jgi:hypothetical protein
LITRFAQNTCFQTGAWLVSRELTSSAGPWTDFDSPDDDGEYFCRIAMNATLVKFVRDAFMYYRVGNVGSLANTRSLKAVKALYRSKVRCINYLLSLEDSERTRAACVRLLQDWLPSFYPHTQAIMGDAQTLAARLGGSLHRPEVRSKYRWMQWLLGYDAALKASRTLPRIRAQMTRTVDRYLYLASSIPQRLSLLEGRAKW